LLHVLMPPRCASLRALPVAACAVAALAAMAAGGCNKTESHREVFPVKGQLFFDKKPASGAVVWLHDTALILGAADVAARADEPRPRGIVQADGSFEISTYGTGDGAPIGRYRLAIFWTKPTERGDDDGESLLPTRYQDPRNAALPIIEVKSQPNVLPPLHLTR
jgi:hypothetical protein